MQRIAFNILFLILLGQINLVAQSVYNTRVILVSSSAKERLNPCYYLTIVDSVANGVVEDTAGNGGKVDLTYTPNPGFTGNDTLVIRYEDMVAGGKIIYRSYIYQTVNSILETKNDFITVYKGQNDVEINVLENDYSSIKGISPFSIKNIPAYFNLSGTPAIVSDSIIKFSTTGSTEGAGSLTYRVCDTFGLCKEAIVNISIVDTLKLKLSDTISVFTPEDQSFQILLPYFGFAVDVSPKHGSITFEGTSVLYKPHNNYNGLDTFIVKKSNLKRYFFVQVLPMPEQNSVIMPDVFFTPVDQAIVFDVSQNDLKSVIGQYPIKDTNKPSKGILNKLNTKGLFEYIPQAGYSGVQTFEYQINIQGIPEYATVRIYIGDYEPLTDASYEIKTYKNLPILLSYQIPINAYNFSSTSDSLSYYPGWDTVTINAKNNCSYTFIGYNQLIYRPLLNTVGIDTFSINYCIDSTGNCVTANIKIEVLLESANCNKQCAGDCVWPGDVDMNGQVDMKDLLSLGYELGETGPARSLTGNSFRAHHANNWGKYLANTGLDLKNADCNGDSVININDTLAIFNSYGSKHSLVPNEIYSKGNFPIYFNILDTSLNSGDIGMIEVQIGDDQYKAVNVSGYSYVLDYNKKAIVDSSLYVDYYEQDWFGRTATLINMFKKPYDGRLESGFVRTNGAKVSGKGKTEVLVYIVEDDLQPFGSDYQNTYLPFHFSNIIYQGENGIKYKLEDTTVFVNRNSKQSEDKVVILKDKKLIVYPNPASEYIMIHMNGRNSITSYELFSINGKQIISNHEPDPKQNQLSILGLTNGVYILKVQTPVGVITRKIEILN
ncbi:MAG: T9SS type A sorting domain-containing protein [Saprospiraceae bacterium]|nr:T9SS type A sorting domain-containing protein [Saprospiraceae bacterium]